ncbi:MAG TPA: DEAD/DEAH box helicase, partial [Treponemataceae bacterium]|nr:DEAD/DEAH box helicase [Treponemataceae bacterium]
METHVPVDEDICIKRAREVFGIPYLFPWQRLVIANILDAIASKNAPMDEEEQFDEDGVLRGQQIVLLPTGAGKSLCFQLPAVLLEGQTLVIYPLLALMGDQERRLREAGVETVIFRGEQDANTRQDCLDRLEGKNGRSAAQLIIANPEVLAGEKLLDRIARRNIAHIAIDEAHCVSEWGDSFRPAYLGLGDIIKRINAPAVTAFTAT